MSTNPTFQLKVLAKCFFPLSKSLMLEAVLLKLTGFHSVWLLRAHHFTCRLELLTLFRQGSVDMIILFYVYAGLECGFKSCGVLDKGEWPL